LKEVDTLGEMIATSSILSSSMAQKARIFGAKVSDLIEVVRAYISIERVEVLSLSITLNERHE
jgi:hypothetical protein